MYDILYTALGGMCIFFSCINVISTKISFSRKLVLLLFTQIFLLLLSKPFDHFSGLITLVGILIIIFLYTKKWLDLSCALFGYLLTISTNYIYIGFTQIIFGKALEQVLVNDSLTLLISIVFCFICFLLTKLTGYILHKYLDFEIILVYPQLSRILFITLGVMTFFFAFNISFGDYIGYSYGVIAFNSILFLTFYIFIATLMFFLYLNIQQKQDANKKLRHYHHLQAYTNEVEKIYDSMRSFKHDYVNILLTFSGYIEENNMPGLKAYYQKEILPISQTFSQTDTKLGLLANIRILEIKSLLSSKLIYAIECDITVGIELTDVIEDVYINTIDFCRIMGIFFDNAIEATLESNEKTVNFCLIKEPDKIVMILQNSASPPTSPLGTLTKLGVSSKGEHRGIGLFNAKKIIDSYSNILWDIKFQDAKFIQILTIFDEQGATS